VTAFLRPWTTRRKKTPEIRPAPSASRDEVKPRLSASYRSGPTRGGLGQFGQGNAAGGHAGAVEAIPRLAASPMTSRRFPSPWRASRMLGRLWSPGRQWAGARPHLRPRRRGRNAAGEGADEGRGAKDRHQRRAVAGAAREGGSGLTRFCRGPPQTIGSESNHR
jgi:hypothetical protein